MRMGSEKGKNWFRRHWIITIILVLVVLGMIGALFDSGDVEDSLQQQNSEDEAPVLFNIGETFVVDDVAFTVNKVSTETGVGVYVLGSFFGEEADGIFYVLDLTLENKAQESKDMLIEQFKIVDSQGRKFDYDTVAEFSYDEGGKGAITFGQQLQPGLPISGVKVFDLPETAEGLKLEITCCGFMSETVQVDLGV